VLQLFAWSIGTDVRILKIEGEDFDLDASEHGERG
jgi:hypothetical protein